MEQELLLIRGLPGSGKTTMARALSERGYAHFEADKFFERGGRYAFDPRRLPDAHAWCLSRAVECIRRGRACVVSNTFTTMAELRPYLDAAALHGVSVRVIEALGAWSSVHGVPAHTIERMRARWEPYQA